LFTEDLAKAFLSPPKDPDDCVFARMSANYSADLKSRVEPCVFGGAPDCSQCGCAISSGLHWVRTVKVAGPVKVDHFIQGSMNVGRFVNRFRARPVEPERWVARAVAPVEAAGELVQIGAKANDAAPAGESDASARDNV
jgi:hypothetical protein